MFQVWISNFDFMFRFQVLGFMLYISGLLFQALLSDVRFQALDLKLFIPGFDFRYGCPVLDSSFDSKICCPFYIPGL